MKNVLAIRSYINTARSSLQLRKTQKRHILYNR